MSNCLYLPDAPADPEQDGDQWLFSDDSGCSDWVLFPEDLAKHHALYASSRLYTVQRFPGMTEEQRADADREWAYENSPRWHGSLSAAERNA